MCALKDLMDAVGSPNVDCRQDGAAIDYTPGTDVAAGDVVVQGELVGVAKRDSGSASEHLGHRVVPVLLVVAAAGR